MGDFPASGSDDRLHRTADIVEIQQLIGLFNAAADSSNLDILKDIWHEECELIYGTAENEAGPRYGKLLGHTALESVVKSEHHQRFMRLGSAHINSLPYVVVEGDRASATTYQVIFVNVDASFIVDTVTANRWQFLRTERGWKIKSRATESMHGGYERAINLLRCVREV